MRKTQTVACRLTSPVPSAVAVIVMEGSDVEEVVQRFWTSTVSKPLSINAIRYGEWRAARDAPQAKEAGEAEGVVVCLTAQHRLEVHCHGGAAAAERILGKLARIGVEVVACEALRPSEVKLAWDGMHLEEDPLSGEAWRLVPFATTPRCTQILLDQSRGALTRALMAVSEKLRKGELVAAKEQVEWLLSFGDLGRHLLQPWKLALVGPPNVGKSKLLNAILGYERAIVDSQPGTTRDALAEMTAIAGWPVEFIDTAGVRSTTDLIELAGIDRALHTLASAEIVLLLVSPDQGWLPIHDQLLAQCKGTIWVVHSKRDLGRCSLPEIPQPVLEVSSLTTAGIQPLLSVLAERFCPESWQPGTAVPFTTKLIGELEEMAKLLAANEGRVAERMLQRCLQNSMTAIAAGEAHE